MNHMHQRNMQLQDLICENEELRGELVGFCELQQCADQLLLKLQAAKEREIDICCSNDQMKQQLNEMRRQTEHNKAAHAEEMRFVLTQHDILFAEKDHQINGLAAELDKTEVITMNLQRDLKSQVEVHRGISDQHERTMQRFEKDFQSCQIELTEMVKYLKQEQSERCKDKEQFNTNSREEQRVTARLKEEALNLTSVIQKIQEDNLFLADFIQELELSIVKKDEDHENGVRHFQREIQKLASLEEQLILQKNELLKSNEIIVRQMEEDKRLQVHLKDQNQTLYQARQKLASLQKQSAKEISFLQQKLSLLEEEIEVKLHNYERNASHLIEENTYLCKNIKDLEQIHNSSKIELSEVTHIKNTLQSTSNQLQGDLTDLIIEMKDSKSKLELEMNKNRHFELENQKLSDLVNVLKVEYSNMESVNARIKQEMDLMIEQNQHILRTTLMDQTTKMMIQFKEEREDHVKILRLEKEKLKENYQYQLRSKDVTYLKEIATLRTEFAVNKPFDTQGRDSKMYSTFKY